jgi:hypothetical protein
MHELCESSTPHIDKQLVSILQTPGPFIFPNFEKYPYHVREIFEYFKALITKKDLLDFVKGKLFKDNIINVYFKILEKINLVDQSFYNF